MAIAVVDAGSRLEPPRRHELLQLKRVGRAKHGFDEPKLRWADVVDDSASMIHDQP